ncbi:MAG: NAD+ synthase [Candidatus Omnitrophica bacterium]|nr:NAD+ synthase [Candidatus Omnitrophota bacterium]
MKERIIFWIKEYVKKSRAKGVVLGLSGGLDSSVVGVLCRKALGRNKVLALILPCHSEKKDIKDALFLAKRFDINTRLIDLSGIYDNFIKLLPCADKITLANLKVRLRMVVLYYFANKLNYLVCGTSNKSELMTGYFTKFGDGASDMLPIGDLLKSQVKELAKELNIPQAIIDKIPSAGLWLGQTDEKELGVSYHELDMILEKLERKKRPLLPKDKVDKVKEKIRFSEHKRRLPEICFIKKWRWNKDG